MKQEAKPDEVPEVPVEDESMSVCQEMLLLRLMNALRIDHLHASENILIEMLIAVTSRLDAVVTSRNVLHAMENFRHDVFNVRLIKKLCSFSNYSNGMT